MRRFTLALASVALLLLLGHHSSSAQTPKDALPPPKVEDAVPGPKKEVVVEPRAGDGQIARRLRDILLATGWFINPVVTVREGVVFMDGEAREEVHRKWAADLAQNTQDVVAVVNRIDIRREINWDFDAASREVNLLYWQIARSLPLVLLGTVVLLISWGTSKVVAALARHFWRRRIPSPLLLNVVARAIAIPVFLLGVYIVLLMSNLTRLALTILGGTGILGLVLGFAFRDIAENFLASLFLSLRNPFRSGDYISVDGSEGVVQSLNTRSTVLLTLDGNHVQIPNAVVFKSKITNYSSNPYRRSEFFVGIGYDSSISEAQRIILALLKTHPVVLAEPEPLVLVNELSGATVNLKILYWFDSKIYSPNKIRSALLRLTKRALLEAGISMPDDAREVIFPQGVPIVRFDKTLMQGTAINEKSQIPVPQAVEVGEPATGAEGNLVTEEREIVVKTGASSATEGDVNLLRDNKPA